MKFQFAQSKRQIEATKVTQFTVVQDNRNKQVTIIQYEGRNGPAEISFLNGVEATLNNRGRYVQAKSNREDCAMIIIEEPEEVVEEVKETTETEK